MAEARLGVDPIIVEGANFDLNVWSPTLQISFEDKGTVIFIPRFSDMFRNLVRRIKGALTKMKVAFAPLPLPVVGAGVASFVFATIYSKNSHWWKWSKIPDFLWQVDKRLGFLTNRWPTNVKIGNLAVLTSITTMYTFAAGQRFVLRRLLEYRNWMNERKGVSLTTKVWYALLKYMFIHRIHETLLAYQPCLPALPLPGLESTVDKYWRSVDPLLTTGKEKEAHRAEMGKFLKEEGPQLQRLLFLKWLTSDNYVSDWWLQAIYLRSRESLMINSNWYGITFAKYLPSRDQAARAAATAYTLGRVQRSLETGTFEPQLVRGVVPLCMDQYQYVFGTTRIAREACDILRKTEYADSRHMVVLHKGIFYRVPLVSSETRRQYTPLQLATVFNHILADQKDVSAADIDGDASRLLPVLTTMNRDHWANIRETEFLHNRANKRSLSIIESAAFLISLDSEPEPVDLDEKARRCFVGTGCNRWCDKSCQWVVSVGGRTGVHGEHSWGDAPVIAHIQEIVAVSELKRDYYNEDGSTKRIADDDLPSDACAPTRLRFEMNKRLAETVFEARDVIRKSIADVVVPMRRFGHFGKKLMSRSIKVSPDAFIQMSLQLAYYRDQGHFDQTYESSMTRFFKHGRTETIRSLSQESCAFVTAFDDPNVSAADKYKLFQAACNHHQEYSHQAMCGEAVDRHLFALYVVSIVRGIDSPFLKNAMTARKWKLSTSQIPPQQLAEEWYKDIPKENLPMIESPNGGFGPVADDGYGVCYMVRDDCVWFTVSSRPSKENTDSLRMHKRIERALLDVKETFENVAQ